MDESLGKRPLPRRAPCRGSRSRRPPRPRRKPLKYPLIVRTCDLVLINKVDLLPHLEFDMDFLRNLEAVHPDVLTETVERRSAAA